MTFPYNFLHTKEVTGKRYIKSMKRTSSVHGFQTLLPCKEHNQFTKYKKRNRYMQLIQN